MTFRVRNDSAADIYLRNDCHLDFQLQPGAGTDPRDLIYDVPESACTNTCEAAQKGPPNLCEACDPGSVRVAPGGTFDVPWDGRGSMFVAMPSQCYAAGGSTTCNQYVAARTGSYTLQMTAYQQCTGDCSCDQVGNCTGPLSGLSGLANPVSFSFPQENLVEVIFDACVFGCP